MQRPGPLSAVCGSSLLFDKKTVMFHLTERLPESITGINTVAVKNLRCDYSVRFHYCNGERQAALGRLALNLPAHLEEQADRGFFTKIPTEYFADKGMKYGM